jgi:head-tail adaptor
MNLGKGVTNPGELRTLVTIKAPTISDDAGGAQVSSWTGSEQVYVKWVNAHGRELIGSDVAQARRRATVWMRWNSTINTKSAILKGSELWQVISVDNVRERGEYMELLVEITQETVTV